MKTLDFQTKRFIHIILFVHILDIKLNKKIYMNTKDSMKGVKTAIFDFLTLFAWYITKPFCLLKRLTEAYNKHFLATIK